MKTALLIIGGSILLLVLMVFMRGAPEPPQDFSALSTRELATLCDREMAGGYHVHPTLEIFANGEKVNVPPNIGVGPTCMTVLHTHTPDGLIHVESPEQRDFTLSDFFAAWKQPFNENEILTYRADGSHRIRVTVNGAAGYLCSSL
jgi:hypothetical protein